MKQRVYVKRDGNIFYMYVLSINEAKKCITKIDAFEHDIFTGCCLKSYYAEYEEGVIECSRYYQDLREKGWKFVG